jgi:hypothetical protein
MAAPSEVSVILRSPFSRKASCSFAGAEVVWAGVLPTAWVVPAFAAVVVRLGVAGAGAAAARCFGAFVVSRKRR